MFVNCQVVYTKFCTNVFEKSDFLLNQFVLKMLCHTCDLKMYYIVLQCSKMINDMSSWKQTILHFELINSLF